MALPIIVGCTPEYLGALEGSASSGAGYRVDPTGQYIYLHMDTGPITGATDDGGVWAWNYPELTLSHKVVGRIGSSGYADESVHSIDDGTIFFWVYGGPYGFASALFKQAPGGSPVHVATVSQFQSLANRWNCCYNPHDNCIWVPFEGDSSSSGYIAKVWKINVSTGAVTDIITEGVNVSGQRIMGYGTPVPTPDGAVWTYVIDYKVATGNAARHKIRRYDTDHSITEYVGWPGWDVDPNMVPALMPQHDGSVWFRDVSGNGWRLSPSLELTPESCAGFITGYAVYNNDLSVLGWQGRDTSGSYFTDDRIYKMGVVLEYHPTDLTVPSLRMRQRDDNLRVAGQPRNTPRSIQRSIRAGGRNRYL